MFQVRKSGTNTCFSLTDSKFINLCEMFFCSDSQQVGQFFDYDSPFKDKTTLYNVPPENCYFTSLVLILYPCITVPVCTHIVQYLE